MEELRLDANKKQQHGGHAAANSALKLPRIQIPRFEDNASETLNWENFKHMMTKLTTDMAQEERIFVLKSALSGDSAKLVANENDYNLAIAMLSSVYGNELLQSQSKIQEFIALVHEDATEKNHTTANRALWQKFKLFSNFLEQQLQNQTPSLVLNSLVCALIVQRTPFQMKQLIIRTRRELEAQNGTSLTLEELLNLYNNLIHDLEISQGSQKERIKTKKDEKEYSEPPKHKKRSLLSKKGKGTMLKRKNVCYVFRIHIISGPIILINMVIILSKRFVKL